MILCAVLFVVDLLYNRRVAALVVLITSPTPYHFRFVVQLAVQQIHNKSK